MRSKRYPPILAPYAKPLKQPLVHPVQLDPSCVLALLPQRDSKWYDYSGNGNHGTLNGAIFKARGTFGPTMFLDGVNNSVSGNDSALPTGTDPRTIEMWINPNDLTINYQALVFYGTQLADHGILLSTDRAADANKLVLGRYGGNSGTSIQLLTIDIWQHVALTLDASGNVTFYINAISDQTTISGLNTLLGGTYKIGAGWNANDNYSNNISEVRIYNRVLTPDEIKRNYELGRLN